GDRHGERPAGRRGAELRFRQGDRDRLGDGGGDDGGRGADLAAGGVDPHRGGECLDLEALAPGVGRGDRVVAARERRRGRGGGGRGVVHVDVEQLRAVDRA